MLKKEDIISDLKSLGIKQGDLLNVKISLKSIGKVDGGADTVIEALLETVGIDGTIFCDSFVSSFFWLKLFFLKKKCIVNDKTTSYAGAIANAMIKYPNSKRSPHPIQKFVAIGKESNIVLKHKITSKPYSVLYELAQRGGKNLRVGPVDKVIGVGTTHCAIEELKLKQNILKTGVSYIDENGEIKKFYHSWPTACPNAFNNLLPIHRTCGGIISEKKIGNAQAVLSELKRTLDIELLLGKQFPAFLRCTDPSCITCRYSWKNSHESIIKVIYENFKRKNFKRILLLLYMFFFRNYCPK